MKLYIVRCKIYKFMKREKLQGSYKMLGDIFVIFFCKIFIFFVVGMIKKGS